MVPRDIDQQVLPGGGDLPNVESPDQRSLLRRISQVNPQKGSRSIAVALRIKTNSPRERWNVEMVVDPRRCFRVKLEVKILEWLKQLTEREVDG